jgi:hypothetical protein
MSSLMREKDIEWHGMEKAMEIRRTILVAVTLVLAALLLACGAKGAPIIVPAGAQAGELVGLQSCTYQPLDFDVGLGWPTLAKLALGLVVIVPLLLAALVWFVVRWARRRRGGRV